MTNRGNARSTREAQQEQDKTASPSKMIALYKQDFAVVMPSHMRAEAFVRQAQGYLARLGDRGDALRRAAAENPYGMLACFRDAARLGLEPGETYHLVPFGKEIVGIVDYKGELELIYRAGAVSSVQAEIVYENDHYVPPQPGTVPVHEYDPFGDRGEARGAYAFAVMRDGRPSKVIQMSRDEIERHRNVSAQWKTALKYDRTESSLWVLWWESMWLKTVVHQLHKWVPTSTEYLTAQVAAVERGRERAAAGSAPAAGSGTPAEPRSAVSAQQVPAEQGSSGSGGPGEVVEGEIVQDPPDNPGFGPTQQEA